MKFIVIWFILTSASGQTNGTEQWMSSAEIQEEKVNEHKSNYILQNYKIFDTWEEAKKFVDTKFNMFHSNDIKCYIYELGESWEVVREKYKTTEVVDVEKYNTVIKKAKI